MRALLCLLAIAAALVLRADSVLWFWVENDNVLTLVDGTETTVSAYTSSDGHAVEGARVRVQGAGGDTFLNLYAADGEDGWLPLGTEVDYADSGTRWGKTTGAVMADVTGYESASPDVSFLVELGYWNEDADFVLLAVASQGETYEKLQEAGFISTGGLAAQPQTLWSTSYAVPEPSSALLLVIGGALLALRRRNMLYYLP